METTSSPVRRSGGRFSRALSWAVLWLGTAWVTTGAEPAWMGRNTTSWEKDMQAFVEADRKNPPPTNAVLFVGSSSIRLWKTLETDFPKHHVINRGFGGSILIDSIYFADRIITPYRPRMVVVYAGTNDINDGKKPAEVEGDFRALTAKIHTVLPETRIVFISVAANPKRWSQRKDIRDANGRVSRFCDTDDRLVFVDAFSNMLGPDGNPLPDIFVEDRLHMNAKGYAMWTELITPWMPKPDR